MLRDMAILSNAVVVAVTESHLNDEILSAEVHMAGYDFYRVDRANKVKKGGVALYIR